MGETVLKLTTAVGLDPYTATAIALIAVALGVTLCLNDGSISNIVVTWALLASGGVLSAAAFANLGMIEPIYAWYHPVDGVRPIDKSQLIASLPLNVFSSVPGLVLASGLVVWVKQAFA